MTEDAKFIRDVLDLVRAAHPDRDEQAVDLAERILTNSLVRNAVARHLVAADPEAVRVPLKGKVT